MADESNSGIPKTMPPAKGPKLPLSGLGIASFVIAILSLGALAYAASCLWTDRSAGETGWAGGLGVLVAFFLGIWSINSVRCRTTSPWSLFFAIPPLLVPGILLVCGILWARQIGISMGCGEKLLDLANDILVYSQDNRERYPDPNRWCDLLIEKADVSRKTLRCPADKVGPCSFAMNPNYLSSMSPSYMVVLFEAKPGWNQHGGPELLDPSHHWPRGCHVLFNDMHVEFVREKDLPKLRWTKEQKPQQQ